MKRLRALLHLIKPALRKSDFRRDEARLKQIARSLSGVRDIQAMLETLVKLLDALDDHDDVQNVYGNYELSDALMEKLGG